MAGGGRGCSHACMYTYSFIFNLAVSLYSLHADSLLPTAKYKRHACNLTMHEEHLRDVFSFVRLTKTRKKAEHCLLQYHI